MELWKTDPEFMERFHHFADDEVVNEEGQQLDAPTRYLAILATLIGCCGGQILLVTSRRGWYQEWGKAAQELHAGDVVAIPTDVKHWHGAAKDNWFAHIAIEIPGENTSNEWLEPVSDEDYNAL